MEDSLRKVFRYFNRFMVVMWRMGLGKWINIYPPIIGRIMIVTHIGRKSGKTHRTPVNYAMIDNTIYCVAGFGSGSDWYQNILSDPHVELWLPNGLWSGMAEDISEIKERTGIVRQVLISSGFATFTAGINPYRLSDPQIEAVTAKYRLIRLHLSKKLSGKDGPGDLVWLWPFVIFILLFIIMLLMCRDDKSIRTDLFFNLMDCAT